MAFDKFKAKHGGDGPFKHIGKALAQPEGLMAGAGASWVLGPVGLALGAGAGLLMKRLRESEMEQQAREQDATRSISEGLGRQLSDLGQFADTDIDRAQLDSMSGDYARYRTLAMQHPDPNVRQAAVQQLAQMGGQANTWLDDVEAQRQAQVASQQQLRQQQLGNLQVMLTDATDAERTDTGGYDEAMALLNDAKARGKLNDVTLQNRMLDYINGSHLAAPRSGLSGAIATGAAVGGGIGAIAGGPRGRGVGTAVGSMIGTGLAYFTQGDENQFYSYDDLAKLITSARSQRSKQNEYQTGATRELADRLGYTEDELLFINPLDQGQQPDYTGGSPGTPLDLRGSAERVGDAASSGGGTGAAVGAGAGAALGAGRAAASEMRWRSLMNAVGAGAKTRSLSTVASALGYGAAGGGLRGGAWGALAGAGIELGSQLLTSEDLDTRLAQVASDLGHAEAFETADGEIVDAEGRPLTLPQGLVEQVRRRARLRRQQQELPTNE